MALPPILSAAVAALAVLLAALYRLLGARPLAHASVLTLAALAILQAVSGGPGTAAPLAAAAAALFLVYRGEEPWR